MNGQKLVMEPIDWVFLVWFLGVTIGVGFYYVKRAGKNLSEYFLSARNLPWWALGTSMIATSFASDTPLAVTELVVKYGIAGNWMWWSFLFGGTLTVFLFSRLWRRAEITTEIELIAKRYEGQPAAILRSFKAVFLGVVINSIVFGWVTQAMGEVIEVAFGLDHNSSYRVFALAGMIVVTLVYTALSGLWGVVATDVLQFAVAMIGTIVLAVLSVNEVGGLEVLVTKVQALEVSRHRDILSIVPTGWDAVTGAVLILAIINWWAVYYPGAEPGGGGYIAQRMFSASDERHARAGTLWYIFAHYVIRPWPWVLVALSAIVLEPRFLDPAGHAAGFLPRRAYPWMFFVLPAGMRGLMMASFAAAYMSTITSLLNLSASYLVNDLYLPLRARGASSPAADSRSEDRRQVFVARLAVLLVTGVGCSVTLLLESITQGWGLVMELTAGTGLVLILRWLWWRVNAWSEISAMVTSACVCLLSHSQLVENWLVRLAGGKPNEAVGPMRLLLIALVTTIVWCAVTLLTRPVSLEHLESFYRTVRPYGWWRPVAKATGIAPAPVGNDVILWGASSAFVFGALFGLGSALLLRPGAAALWLIVAAIGGIVVVGLLRREKA